MGLIFIAVSYLGFALFYVGYSFCGSVRCSTEAGALGIGRVMVVICDGELKIVSYLPPTSICIPLLFLISDICKGYYKGYYAGLFTLFTEFALARMRLMCALFPFKS